MLKKEVSNNICKMCKSTTVFGGLIGYEPPGKKKNTKGRRKEKAIKISRTKEQQIDGQICMFAM